METDLVNEICKRVREKLQAIENQQMPAVLILTEEHKPLCHETLENTRLSQYYRMDCALLSQYQCRLENYEAVVVYTLSNEALGKVAHGIFDNGFTRLLAQALLEGKKIYAVQEGIQLYQYRDKAPKAFYKALEANLELLKESGVVILPHAQVPDGILHGEQQPEAAEPEPPQKPEAALREETGKRAVLNKKVITEKDMISLGNRRVKEVGIPEKGILTDLAKEYAAKHRILICREKLSSGKGEQGL